MVGGLGKIDDQSFMFIGTQKGYNTKTRQYRNFGMANPEGYRKALRLMKSADKFGVPIITFIDTPGAFPGLEAEERGQGEAIARNIFEMMSLNVPIIVVIIGEGASSKFFKSKTKALFELLTHRFEPMLQSLLFLQLIKLIN